MHGHQVKHPGHGFAEGAGPAGAEDRLALGEDLRLNKEVAERRMQRVRGRRCENDFRVTRDLDRPARPGAVGDGDSAEFDIILGRDGDFRMRVEVVVAAAELCSRMRENRFVIVRLLERRLIGGRPELPAGHVAEVTERAPVVAGSVFAPARDCDVLPTAVTAPRVRDHHVVSAVRQQLHFWDRRVRAAENAHPRLRAGGSRT